MAPPWLARSRTVLRAVYREIRAENVPFLAGSVAYHAFVSLLPFLLLVLIVVSRVGGEQLATDVLRSVAGFLTPDLQSLLVRAARNAAGNAGISVVGGLALVWGVLRIFRGLDTAFSDIYESEGTNTFLDQLVDGVAVFGALAAAILVVGLADTLVALPALGPLDPLVRPLATVAGITVALVPMFYVFPDERVTVREVLPGTLAVAVGWTALGAGFKLYVRFSSTTEYGVVGAVIVLVTWLYFAGLLLLVGAALNAVLAGRSEDVDAIPWGRPPDGSATDGDADFVASLRELDGALADGGPVTICVGDRSVSLDGPTDATVTVTTVDRPRLLGGRRERGRIELSWASD